MKLATVFWACRLDGKQEKLHALDVKRPWGKTIYERDNKVCITDK